MTQRTDPAAMSGQRRRAGRAEVERDVVGGIPASGLDGIKPAGWSPVRDAVGHLTAPAAFAVLAMVKTANQRLSREWRGCGVCWRVRVSIRCGCECAVRGCG